MQREQLLPYNKCEKPLKTNGGNRGELKGTQWDCSNCIYHENPIRSLI
uniref:Uncharacterized protein n=1 Tax=Triticum urartu TaxID=4572 RepID=A0A8R7TZW2_TRIUA